MRAGMEYYISNTSKLMMEDRVMHIEGVVEESHHKNGLHIIDKMRLIRVSWITEDEANRKINTVQRIVGGES
jgi:hypothetical protein